MDYNSKYKVKSDEVSRSLLYGNLRGKIIAYSREDWFDYALKNCKNDIDLFEILLKGC